MIKVIPLKVTSVQTATAFEVAIATAMRELQGYDALDQPHNFVKFLQVFETKDHGWMGVFWVAPLTPLAEPVVQQPLRTPEIDRPAPIPVVIVNESSEPEKH